ncbi:hypothetical protein [Aureimonas jatrophae]|uniref:hypothetical protein n=1 Tax=Aureimonas jatrophae TaxID=1166073 RepID=UPI0014817549|nr:hypothetical protein [Aureimonas jatrophae]MBB3952177.1 hypothetical protein [Aureimonas jatrophae]
MLPENEVRAAVATSVAIAVPVLAWWVDGIVAPALVAVGAASGLCVWFWRRLLP